MIPIKTRAEIEKIRRGGKILARILAEVKREARAGVTTSELDSLAEDLIVKAGGKPSFKTVPGYKWATCMCVNEVVVHGVPGSLRLKEGDILGIDIGLLYQGFHSDASWTVLLGKKTQEKIKFLRAGEEALRKATEAALVGNRVGHISASIEETVRKAGFAPVRALVGHGIGKKLHEEPQIPCFLAEEVSQTPRLLEGMTLAIEVIYNQGRPEISYQNGDGWTIVTADGGLSGLFEDTVAVLRTGPERLTKPD